jgi:hypothetical protein
MQRLIAFLVAGIVLFFGAPPAHISAQGVGTPSVGATYEVYIPVANRQRIPLPPGSWTVNNIIDEKKSFFSSSEPTVVLLNQDPASVFKSVVLSYSFSSAQAQSSRGACFQKKSALAFAQDLTEGNATNPARCSRAFDLSGLQDLLTNITQDERSWADITSKFPTKVWRDHSNGLLLFQSEIRGGRGVVRIDILIGADQIFSEFKSYKDAFTRFDGYGQQLLEWRGRFMNELEGGFLRGRVPLSRNLAFLEQGNDSTASDAAFLQALGPEFQVPTKPSGEGLDSEEAKVQAQMAAWASSLPRTESRPVPTPLAASPSSSKPVTVEVQREIVSKLSSGELAAEKEAENARLAQELARLRAELDTELRAKEAQQKPAKAKQSIEKATQPVTRRALLIGNDNYIAVPKLNNAREDARAMSRALEKLGFKVTLRTDLNERQTKEVLRTFKEQVQGGDEVVFFFAGHGIQISGSNYLLPVDTRSISEAQVRDESIPLQRVLDDIEETKARFTLAIIDACRDNPFKVAGRSIGGRGLAPTSAATGQMVIFSAGAGQQALDRLGDNDRNPNGVFTRVLIREMEREGVAVDRILRNVRSEVVRLAKSVGHEQVPALYDQALGDFYFKQ